MKNASLTILCCILLLLALSILSSKCNFTIKSNRNNYKISVLDVENNVVLQLPLEEYVWRVTAKEMPLSFHDEALKAQIVIARTYVIRKKFTKSHQNNIDACTDFNHCTAFLKPEEDVDFFNNDKSSYNRLISLSQSTRDQIITYNNEPILAVFHATSSGMTEKSSDIWQSQLPYLINVESNIDKNANGYYSEKSFSEKEIMEILNIDTPPKFDDAILTDAGSVKTLKINQKIYSGTEIRKLFNLRSNNFEIINKNGKYTFCVRGYGHGVGMSQTGANEYAKNGLNYRDIIFKYYPGTEINNLNEIAKTTK